MATQVFYTKTFLSPIPGAPIQSPDKADKNVSPTIIYDFDLLALKQSPAHEDPASQEPLAEQERPQNEVVEADTEVNQVPIPGILNHNYQLIANKYVMTL